MISRCRARLLFFLLPILLTLGCAHTRLPQATSPGPCHARLPFPDPDCTPGVTNPDVTQENISQTICVPGYMETIRPPASYTSSLRVQQIAEYGYSDTSPAGYEEDHLIPLELGGHPRDPRNLWPQPRGGTSGSESKDRIENALQALVCSGQLTLEEAQRRITSDWTRAVP